MKVRQDGRIVSVAVIVAVGVNADGRREVLGMDIGPSEAETFWSGFLRKLARRGLRGVKLVVSDSHEGIKAAISRIFTATWQRCRVHFMCNALAHAGRSGRRVVSAACPERSRRVIATAFDQNDAKAAKSRLEHANWRRGCGIDGDLGFSGARQRSGMPTPARRLRRQGRIGSIW